MSGVELIVGAVLGAVPIAIEAYDRSGRVFEVFSAFIQYRGEVSILDTKLGVQRTIFRNNAIHLLTAITRDRTNILEVINHPPSAAARLDLAMASVYRHRLDALDESFKSCLQTAQQIHSRLQLLCSQSEDFRAEVGERQDDISTSEWLKHIRTRFKLGINKPKMAKAIEDLREFNRDFGLITEQITKSLQLILNEGNGNGFPTRRPAKSLNMLQRYHRVRYASKALYSTLRARWNCNAHQYHSFDVRILDCDHRKGSGKSRATLSRYVTCELAVTHDGSSFPSKGPLHLEIEQACESDDEDNGCRRQQAVNDSPSIQQLTKVLESNADRLKLEATATSKQPAVRKLLSRFRKEKQAAPDSTSTSSIPQLPNLTQSLSEFHLDGPQGMTVQTNSSSLADLSLVDDFCKKVYENMACCENRSFLGSWDGPHAQWFCVPAVSHTAEGGSRSLSDIIGWISEEPVLRSLPRPLLIELAGNVAEGIMQFYSTPWLASTNLGQNVRYFGSSKSESMAVQLEGPYFMARLESTQGKRSASRPCTGSLSQDEAIAPCSDASTANFADARNKLLFRVMVGVSIYYLSYFAQRVSSS